CVSDRPVLYIRVSWMRPPDVLPAASVKSNVITSARPARPSALRMHPVAAKFADRFTIAGATLAGVVGVLLPPHAARIELLRRLNAQDLAPTSRSVVEVETSYGSVNR